MGYSGEDYGYAIDLGLPVRSRSQFAFDPVIKVEAQWVGEKLGRANAFAMRNGPRVQIRGDTGVWRPVAQELAPFDSMMTHCADPHGAPELLGLREHMRGWRFYDHFRTDREAPARRAHIGTYTPVLRGDGGDLAAALQTIREIGDAAALDEAIADAFHGSSVSIQNSEGYFSLEVRQPGLLRPLRGSELSDGTLRYLLLVAALLSPRPPSLMVLNEPEASLHPSLLEPLSRLMVQAALRSQVVVVSHAPALIAALGAVSDCQHFVLEKQLGETLARGSVDPPWAWPER